MKKPPKHVWVVYDEWGAPNLAESTKVEAEDSSRRCELGHVHRYTLDEPKKKAGKRR